MIYIKYLNFKIFQLPHFSKVTILIFKYKKENHTSTLLYLNIYINYNKIILFS